MKYRWGFLDENDIFSECQPKVDDSTAIDFSQESNEIFYRGKLNGSLAFRFEFDDILALGYNYEHRIVLQWYDAANDLWKDVWKGRFALTDCEIDYDTKTITVQPETLDRYTKIFDAFETEYNLVKLAPPMQPVGINIRPCLQIYTINDDKVTNYVGESYWEASCDPTYNQTDLTDTYKFSQIGDVFSFVVSFRYKHTNDEWYYIRVLASGKPSSWQYETWSGNQYRVFYATGKIIHGSLVGSISFPVVFTIYTNNDVAFTVHPPTNQTAYQTNNIFRAEFETADFGGVPSDMIINDQYPVSCGEAGCQYELVYARCLLQTDLPSITLDDTTLTTYDIPANDIAGSVNFNYNKVCPITTACVHFEPSSELTETPTMWGMSYIQDRYFERYLYSNYNPLPIAISHWKYASLWMYPYFKYRNYIDQYSATRTIKDCYIIQHTIGKLLRKAGWNGTNIISQLFAGNAGINYAFTPVITARSNVISSYYNTPAQNAPITLSKVLSMLKQAFKIYWHIDNNDNLHLEHVVYYDNGFTYNDDEPDLLIDLETQLHTNTKNNKVFGQNKVKFEKNDMPEQFAFGWADVQTKPFDGYAIKCQDTYVQKGSKQEQIIGDFDTDVDFVLSSPNDVSKEGLFLFGCPIVGGVQSWMLNVEEISAKDEENIEITYRLQNADAAFIKIHKVLWRYDLPCENINVNNEDTTAITTGRYKVQSVEFADSVMAEILKDIDNCNKVIRTQQGDGHIKTLSINLNSLVAKGDLLFNFVGRWYYLKGTALGASITIFVNGESTTIEVSNNKFTYRYKEPIATLKFNAADVVSVDFADCDKLDNLTSCDEMFDGCEELLAVDFGNKTFGAVTSAINMFRGCIALTTLICPDSSTWKADLDFSDCPDLTLESFYDLIKFLYYYNAGVHTITPNTTFWNALDADTQNDLLTKASARGWTIGIPAQYSITGQSAANTVYATINGSPVEISVVGGSWQYDYNTPITSISFENDADVTDIDFSLSDGLAGLTSLNDAFKNCAGLTTVDFTNCDLSNVASASDAFAGCIALYELIIPQDTWQPDVDLSDGVMPKAEMLNVINGLYDYTSGTHTITFNQTIWDAMSVANQQIVFDAADAKGWTTNAVAVVYVVRGTSSAATETFNIQFIQDGSFTPNAAETITVTVDGNGNWNFDYVNKKIYTLRSFAFGSTTLLTVDFSDADDFGECVSLGESGSYGMLRNCTNLTAVTFGQKNDVKLIDIGNAFRSTKITALDLSGFTFANVTNAQSISFSDSFVEGCTQLQSVDLKNATFAALVSCQNLFYNIPNLQSVDLRNATFAVAASTLQMFKACGNLTSVRLDKAIFSQVTSSYHMFHSCSKLTTIEMPLATFENDANAQAMFSTCSLLTTLDMSAATFEKMTNVLNIFNYDTALTTITLTKIATAILPNSGTNSNVVTSVCPLTYSSILNLANWVIDLTGYTARTMTFKATAWNALSAAEQSTIDSILSGKNWTRAIA